MTAGRAPHLVGFHCGVDVEVVSVDGQGNPLHGELFVASNTAHPTDIDPRLQRGELPSSKKEIEPADFTLSDQIWTIETDPHLAAIEPEGTTVAYGPAKERDLEDKFQGVGGSTADRYLANKAGKGTYGMKSEASLAPVVVSLAAGARFSTVTFDSQFFDITWHGEQSPVSEKRFELPETSDYKWFVSATTGGKVDTLKSCSSGDESDNKCTLLLASERAGGRRRYLAVGFGPPA